MAPTKFIDINEFLKKNPIVEKPKIVKIDYKQYCKNGRFCKNQACKFNHNLKTKMCKFENKCKRGSMCNFAHSKEELYIQNCKFGYRCKFENCIFKHPEKIPVVEPIKVLEKTPEELLNIENFPKTIENTEKLSDPTDFTNMKEIIKYTDFEIIKENSIDEMIDKYNCILNFKELKFNFKE